MGGRTVTVGRSDEVPPALMAARDAALAEGRTVVAVSVDGEGAGVVAVSDVMRPETPRAIAMLRDLGLRPIMLTGDAAAPARAVAAEAADITLVTPDPRAIADAIRLSRRTLRTIQGNLVWAFGYNVAAIPLAVLGLLNPLIAAAAMGLSSIFVVTNSLRLRGFKPAR